MSNGLKDMAELIALLVADLKKDNDRAELADPQITLGEMQEILDAEEEIKLQKFKQWIDSRLDIKGPVWGLVDPRIDSKWDTDE